MRSPHGKYQHVARRKRALLMCVPGGDSAVYKCAGKRLSCGYCCLARSCEGKSQHPRDRCSNSEEFYIEWAATKSTVSRSAAVMTTIPRQAIGQPRIVKRSGSARSPKHPRSNAPQGSAVDSVVKWFNAEKGFGFVAVDGGSEAFLHIRQLQTAGHTSVPEGARLKVLIGQGQKGLEVTEVIEVDMSTAGSPSSTERRRPSRFSGRGPNAGKYWYGKNVQGR